MLRLLYRPLGLIFGVLGGIAASAVFARVWKMVTGDDEAPSATDEDRGWTEVLAAAAVQGAVFGLVKTAVDRGGAVGYRKVTGEWPGDKSSKTDDD
ncbi:DUF4235 domain-containing protein [Kibdelosporangium aridum]|uniref:DUF4235 domain-containing protein n=1 Tax=Kibdelosporangium aridum TaxID=2030 RepID=A0A1W2FSK2_KIBAR|nr:DUF4235 domain-containing protein [Kibdelosporangium aridum]SMD24895.1 Protein of unknown function [Kibdelosporangium aridum]